MTEPRSSTIRWLADDLPQAMAVALAAFIRDTEAEDMGYVDTAREVTQQKNEYEQGGLW